MSILTAFAGSVPENYEKYLGPDLFEPYAKDIAARLRKDQCRNVLELACGTGRVTKHIVALLAEGGRLVATDLNAAMIEVGKARVTDERIQWLTADAHHLPFGDDTFDHVVCQYGVMFFEDKAKALAETFRVLDKGGKFIFNTWGSLEDNPRSGVVADVFTDMFKEAAPDFLEKGPYSFYNTEEIKQMMQAAGFINVSVEEVKKTVLDWTIDDYISGFIEGTPLSAFLTTRDAQTKEVVRSKLKEAFLKKFGVNVETSMLAYVCEGTK